MARRIQALTVDDVLAQLGSDDDGIDWNDSDDDKEEAEDRTFLETSDPLSLAQMSSDLQEDAGDNTLTDIDNTELQVHGSPPFTDTNISTTQPTATSSTQPPTTNHIHSIANHINTAANHINTAANHIHTADSYI